MFNSVNLEALTDWELNKKYEKAVNLALDICQESKDQFKLVETPLKSFVLVSNVLPDDNRPWTDHVTNNFDFSSISLTSKKLLSVNKLEFSNIALDSNIYFSSRRQKDTYKFASYDYDTLLMALDRNKSTIISDAIELMSDPSKWTSIVPVDPLPWLWLLFYGNLSTCGEINCLYKKYFMVPGPILLPVHMYKPNIDICTFMSHVCLSVVSLYGEYEDLSSAFSIESSLPFTKYRLNNIKDQFNLVTDATYVTRRCLLCCLYKQNICAARKCGLSEAGPFILLTGRGEEFLSNKVGNFRDLSTGHNILFPSYNIQQIADRFKSHESEKH